MIKLISCKEAIIANDNVLYMTNWRNTGEIAPIAAERMNVPAPETKRDPEKCANEHGDAKCARETRCDASDIPIANAIKEFYMQKSARARPSKNCMAYIWNLSALQPRFTLAARNHPLDGEVNLNL